MSDESYIESIAAKTRQRLKGISPDILKLLVEQDELAYKHEETIYERYSDVPHYHVCDFEIIYRWFGRKKMKRLVKEVCEKWLATQGLKRDKNLDCCERCPHMKYLAFDKKSSILISASSSIAPNEYLKPYIDQGKTPRSEQDE